jgi:lipopolysaccharide heptosyltransferase I
MRQAERICIIKPSSLGDIIHSLPVLKALRSTYPEARVSWVVAPAYSSLLKGHPDLEEVLIFQRDAWGRLVRLPKTALEVARLVGQLRSRRFDMVIDLQGLLRSALLGWASGSSRRIGLANAREHSPLFYSEKVRVPEGPIHAVERYMMVAQAVTGRSHPVDFPLGLTEEDHARAEDFLKQSGLGHGRPFVVLSPGARWSSKRWGTERFSALGQKMRGSLGVEVVLLGAPQERKLVEEVGRGLDGAPVATFVSLRQAAALLSRARLMVTNDSGAMHLAAAAGCSVVALFGPTDHRLTGPYGPGHVVVRHEVECAPCFLKACPLPQKVCMTGITVDEALRAAERLLYQGRSPEGGQAP